jgi:hypothetical protein
MTNGEAVFLGLWGLLCLVYGVWTARREMDESDLRRRLWFHELVYVLFRQKDLTLEKARRWKALISYCMAGIGVSLLGASVIALTS